MHTASAVQDGEGTPTLRTASVMQPVDNVVVILTGGARQHSQLESRLVNGQSHEFRELCHPRANGFAGVDVANPRHDLDEPEATPSAFAVNEVDECL